MYKYVNTFSMDLLTGITVNRYSLYYIQPKKWKNMGTGAHEKHKKRGTCVHEKCKGRRGRARYGKAGGDAERDGDGDGNGGYGKVRRTESGATTAARNWSDGSL